jgi:hypothetical protein
MTEKQLQMQYLAIKKLSITSGINEIKRRVESKPTITRRNNSKSTTMRTSK